VPHMRPPAWTPPARAVLVLICLLVVLLNVFDAVATLEIMRRGGEEANPLARPMIKEGAVTFFTWKMGLALVCASALGLLARIHRAAWWLLIGACVGYGALTGLHAYLLWFVTRPS